MKMRGVLLPGGRQVEFKEYDVPEPGHGQVLIKMKASSICFKSDETMPRATFTTSWSWRIL